MGIAFLANNTRYRGGKIEDRVSSVPISPEHVRRPDAQVPPDRFRLPPASILDADIPQHKSRGNVSPAYLAVLAVALQVMFE